MSKDQVRISTLSDLVAVANNENCDRLLEDLGAWLRAMVSIKGMVVYSEANMIWKDDGEHVVNGLQINRKP